MRSKLVRGTKSITCEKRVRPEYMTVPRLKSQNRVRNYRQNPKPCSSRHQKKHERNPYVAALFYKITLAEPDSTDAGYKVTEGAIWYAGSRERVRIALDEERRATTRAAISSWRLAAAAGRLPPPLVDSPKCTKCSLAGICLPDEVTFFRRGLAPRPLNPSADTALPLYVQEPGARVTKSGEVLVIEGEEKKTEVSIGDISELVLHGPVSLTTPALGALLREEIPVTYASTGGWVLGHTISTGHRNVAIRIAQSRAAFDERRSLAFARSLVAAKIRNCRVFLRRNFKAGDEAERDAGIEALARLADRAMYASTESELLGFEGEAAARYFRLFDTMFGSAARDFPEFAFEKRTRPA